MEYIEIQGDLFKTKTEFVLAHCIARDIGLGAGIALTFRNKYPEMIRFLNKNRPTGFPSVVKWEGERTVYNLITKERSHWKPKRSSLEQSLVIMKEMMIKSGEKKLAIPLIGSCRDKLDWAPTSKFIKELFADTDITIVVCYL